MDPVKVVIFVAAFLLLLFLGRKLSSSSESTGTSENKKPARNAPALFTTS
jgi:hypothetical protein